MSKAVLFLLFALLCEVGYAQNVGINSTGAAPDASAGLDVSFTNKGFLTPKMTAAQKNAISSPATGLLVYQTDAPAGFYYNSGTPGTPSWTLVSSPATAWGVTGNTGTSTLTDFIGTIDNVSLAFKTWNQERMRIFSSGGVGIGTSTLTSSALLDLTSTTKGMLAPRMTFAQRIAIASPAEGLLVFQNDATRGFYYYSNSAWSYLSTGLSGWTVSGTSSQNLWHNSTGSIGVGTTSFAASNPEKLLVDAGTTSYNVIVGKGNVNGYIQMNLKNASNGGNASTDIVATNDVAGDGVYIDMGINSSLNSNTGTLGGASKAYLFSTGDDFVIGNGTPNKNLTLYSTTTVSGVDVTTEKLRLNSTGVTFSQSLRKTAVSTTLNIDDYTLICINTSDINVNLPSAITFVGRIFYIKNNSDDKITVIPVAGQRIDDLTGNRVISKRNGGLMIQSDGVGWYIIISDLV